MTQNVKDRFSSIEVKYDEVIKVLKSLEKIDISVDSHDFIWLISTLKRYIATDEVMVEALMSLHDEVIDHMNKEVGPHCYHCKATAKDASRALAKRAELIEGGE